MQSGFVSYDTLFEQFKAFYGRRVDAKGEVALAAEWEARQPKTEEEFKAFYSDCNNVDELAYWHIRTDGHPKIKSFRKFYKIIEKLPVRSILDMGAGICTDALQYAWDGYTVFAVEQNRKSIEFALYRANKLCELASAQGRLFTINVREGDETAMGIARFDLVTLIDVIEHFHNPFVALTRLLASRPTFFLFTQAFGVHEPDKGGHPQHTDYDLKKVYAFLRDELKYTKVSLKGAAFPPNLWTTTDMTTLNVKGE